MKTLPDLDRLSHADKDELIRALFAQVTFLTDQVATLTAQVAQVEILTAKVAELEGRLALNSRNSSKPPSSDGLNKPKPKSLRVAGQNPSGGQAGHKGHTLKKVSHPDHTEQHRPPAHCEVCLRPLGEGIVVDTRQVFDIPPMRFEVTEHQLLEARCTCGKVCRGVFPEAVSAPVQYGPHIKAVAVHLTHHHMMPIARTGSLTGDLFGLPLSDATVLAAIDEAKDRLQPTVKAIADALKTAPVAHADETGMRVAGKLNWMHFLATATLTWIGCHPNRGKKAFDAFGILAEFFGTLIHDGWKPYRELLCKHGLCNIHHLRELTYLFEEMQQAWAERMIILLREVCHEVNEVGAPLQAERIGQIRARYEEILCQGEADNPPALSSGNRGKTRQSKATNLLKRLRLYSDDVWRFMTDPGVPFTNNIAEQAVRMPKVKQKISGGFRTQNGAMTFCVIRSYLATLHKQGDNLFHALVLTFQGNPPQPRFS